MTVSDDIPIPITLSYNVIDVSCYGNSTGVIDLTVSGGVSPYSYIWSNGSILQDISNVSAGDYYVTITDAQNQTITDTITINQASEISLSFMITPVSYVGLSNGAIDMSVSGGIPPFDFFWNTNPSQNTEDINNLTVGDYVVYVGYDNWSCFIVDTVNIGYASITGCTD